MKHAESRGLRTAMEGADQVDFFVGFACARVGRHKLDRERGPGYLATATSAALYSGTLVKLWPTWSLARAALRNRTGGIALLRHQDQSSRAKRTLRLLRRHSARDEPSEDVLW